MSAPDPRGELLKLWLDHHGRGELLPPMLHGDMGPRALYRELWASFSGLRPLLDSMLKRGWKHTPHPWLKLLCLAATELVWQEYRGAYGIVDAWVGLAKSALNEKSSGVINACLRRLCRLQEAGEAPTAFELLPARLRELSRTHGMSAEDWVGIVRRPRRSWWHAFDLKAETLPEAESEPWEGGRVFLPEAGLDRRHFEREHSGSGFFQNMTSALIAREVFLHLDRNRGLFDACASPGGKSYQVMRLSQGQQSITAWDADPGRLGAMRDRPASRRYGSLGFASSWPGPGEFHQVLLDVPCSNTGVLAKAPEAIRSFWEGYRAPTGEQHGLLISAAELTGPGGKIYYSTCSLLSEENSELIAQFCRDTGARCEDMKQWLPRPGGVHGGFLARLTL